MNSGTWCSGIASGKCDCEVHVAFRGRGCGVAAAAAAAEGDVMERRRGSRMGEALAELDVEDDMVRFLRAVGDGGGEADVDRE